MIDTIQDILYDLTTLDPSIDNRISDLSSSALSSNTDPASTVNSLLGEALSILLDLLHSNGIEFYADYDLLFSDRYNICFVSALYRSFIPTNIVAYIGDDDTLKRCIQASTDDVADNEYLINILDAVRITNNSQFTEDMYNFLFDKVRSTPKYASTVRELLDDNSYHEALVAVTSSDTAFLMILSLERRWHQSRMSELIYKAQYKIDYKLSVWLSTQFCSGYSIPENLSILARYHEFVLSNKTIVDELLLTIHKRSKFYVDHYSDDELGSISIEIVISIILAQLSDKRLFGIEPNFKRLLECGPPDIMISDIINQIPVQNSI